MMAEDLYSHGYGDKWTDFLVRRREGYNTSVSDFHRHDFYEVNLILSGNVKILLSDRTEQGAQSRIVLTRPCTPHYISCDSDTLYSRLYLLFSHDFLAEYVPEWKKLVSVFGRSGRIITLTPEQKEFCGQLIGSLEGEADKLRQKLTILYLLSYLGEFAEGDDAASEQIPHFVMEALSYIEEHYSERITAEELAKKLYVSRTTLMTAFKKHTDTTLNHYLVNCRLKNAIRLLKQGLPEYRVAEKCGLGDSCRLIRSFRQYYGMTPRQFLAQNASRH